MTKRLYSSFPNGNAAIGLVLLRILIGGGLVELSGHILAGLFAAPESRITTFGEIGAAVALVAGILIVVGFWTSVAATGALILGITSAALGVEPLHSLFFASLSFAVALVGPGAWSVDARLFGWRQIRFTTRNTEARER